LLDDSALDALEAAIKQKYGHSRMLRVSARRGDGISQWLETITGEQPFTGRPMEVDYDTYAEGEALLGWVNLTAALEGAPFDGNAFLAGLMQSVAAQLKRDGIEVAHLKMTLAPSQGNDLAVANLVRDDAAPELVHRLAEPLERGELIVNLRAEGDPAALEQIVRRQLQAMLDPLDVRASVEHSEAFRPGRPTPTHRMAAC
jgi:hypothetical protein